MAKNPISTLRSFLYALSRLLGDVDAVRTGRVGRRVKNRVLGRMAGRIIRRL